MIRPEDAEFHHDATFPVDWCETNYFPFAIPGANISGCCYVLSRPMLGVCMSDISIQDKIATRWEQQIYIDNQQHLPCPKSLLDYSLPNGLSVKVLKPLLHTRIDYVGIDDTELHLDWKALMDPYDVNDPQQDPIAAKRVGKSWGVAFHGHYEVTGHITGKARIRGKDYVVDCIDTQDRSWGVRAERNNPNATWLHASFGPEFTMHVMFACDPATDLRFGAIMSGYVLDHGEVYGLVEGSGISERDGVQALSTRVEVVDVRGRRYGFSGTAVNSSRWAPYSSLVYHQSLMQWTMDGKSGYGIQQDVVSRNYLIRNRDVLFRGASK
jgi:hypothetical protein